MDGLTGKKAKISRQKLPAKKQIKKRGQPARRITKTQKRLNEKFKHYDKFLYKSQIKKMAESKKNGGSRENDSGQVNELPRNLQVLDSPDKTEIIGKISCDEEAFNIDKKSENVSNALDDTVIFNLSEEIYFGDDDDD